MPINLPGYQFLKTTNLENLGDARLVKAGTIVKITNYGGTLATSDGTRWRIGTLYTLWGDKPSVNLVPNGTELSVLDCGGAIATSSSIGWVFKPITISSNTVVTTTIAATPTELMRDTTIPVSILGTKGFLYIETDLYKPSANSQTIRIGNESTNLTSFASTQPNMPWKLKLGMWNLGFLRNLTPYTNNGSVAGGTPAHMLPTSSNLSLFLTVEGTAGDLSTMYGYTITIYPSM